MYFICCLSGCGVVARNLLKILNNREGLVVCLQYPCPAFSGLVCAGQSSKQWCITVSAKSSWIKLFHWICGAVVGICTLQMFRKFWVLLFWFRDWGWALSPFKNSLNLDYRSNLMTNLIVGVRGFDEFHGLHGCEIVGWVSGESGCLWFPTGMKSLILFGRT